MGNGQQVDTLKRVIKKLPRRKKRRSVKKVKSSKSKFQLIINKMSKRRRTKRAVDSLITSGNQKSKRRQSPTSKRTKLHRRESSKTRTINLTIMSSMKDSEKILTARKAVTNKNSFQSSIELILFLKLIKEGLLTTIKRYRIQTKSLTYTIMRMRGTP